MANEEMTPAQPGDTSRPADEEAIRRQMEATRSSLAEKLHELEREVMDTVHNATSAVSGTVETVRETVEGTVEKVRETVEGTMEGVTGTVSSTLDNVRESLNVGRHMREHPWINLGASVALGFFLGNALGPRILPSGPPRRRRFEEHRPTSEAVAAAPQRPAEPGWFSQTLQKLEPEINRLKGMALGTALGLLRDVVTRNVPEQMRAQITEIFDDVTKKLGGQKVEGVGDWLTAEEREQAQTGFETGRMGSSGPGRAGGFGRFQ